MDGVLWSSDTHANEVPAKQEALRWGWAFALLCYWQTPRCDTLYLHADNPQCTPFWQFQYAQTQADTLSDIVPRDARADYVLIIGIRRRVTRVRFGVEVGSLCLGLAWGIRLLWV